MADPVISTSPRYKAYNQVAATTVFAGTFPVLSPDDVQVKVNGVEVTSGFNFIGAFPRGEEISLCSDWSIVFATGQTGLVELIGDRSPRSTTRTQEGVGVPARDLNTALYAIIISQRELYDRIASLETGISPELGGLITAGVLAYFATLPTTLPPSSGVIWNNGGSLSVS